MFRSGRWNAYFGVRWVVETEMLSVLDGHCFIARSQGKVQRRRPIEIITILTQQIDFLDMARRDGERRNAVVE